ncbi:IS3 family transposase [Embleya sp. MST-111070]|uniref:IS3 family transposase n=1 Tax=Embleya sp. MST-111070 TaxID=3398231 RepID=UPI003F735563
MRTLLRDFVSTHRAEFGVKRLCRVLGLSRSSFHAHEAAAPARRAHAAADAELTERIRVVHAASHETYGVPRITAELRADGHGVNHKRTARLMRGAGIVGRHLRRRVRTTVRDRAAVPAPDLVERDFTASARDVKWVGDITHLPVGDGWVYLATVIDLHSRRLIGWSIADHMRASLVVDAIEAAVRTRGGSVVGVVFHSDRGSQGGFNWSSQHLEGGGVDGQAGGMDAGVDGQGRDEVAGKALTSS